MTLKEETRYRSSYSCSCTDLDRPLGLQMVEAPRITRQLAHEGETTRFAGKSMEGDHGLFRSIFQTAKPMNVMRQLDISSAPRNIKESKVL